MKIRFIMAEIFIFCLMLTLAGYPPNRGYSLPKHIDTAYAPSVNLLDTPEFNKGLDRLDRKTDELNAATKTISQNSKHLERATKTIRRDVAAITQKKEDTTDVADDPTIYYYDHELPADSVVADPVRKKKNIWYRIKHIF